MDNEKGASDAIVRCESHSTTTTSSLSPCANSVEGKRHDEPALAKKSTSGIEKEGGTFFNLPFPLGSLVPDRHSNSLEEHNLIGIEDRIVVEEDRPDFIIRSTRRALMASSTREERQNEHYARKVGINFSISRGDYLKHYSGCDDDASDSVTADGSVNTDISSSPQYGKKDNDFTFRSMFGEVGQHLDSSLDCEGRHAPQDYLITPKTRQYMIDHNQEEKLRQRAAALSVDWANTEYMAPALARRLRDFEFAQKKRRRKFGKERLWGVLGLYDFLSAVRTDVEWAEDAAWRREHCLPYLPWKEFIAEKKGQNNMPVFTYTILFLCTLLLLISFALNGWTFESLSINPSLGPSPEILLRLGAKDSMLIVNEYEIWRLFTPMVLHGGLVHFFLNCFALFYISRAVEQNHGSLSTLILFCVPAVGSIIISAIFLPQFISVGASGGIFGLIGACVADITKNWRLIFSDFINKGRSKRHHLTVVVILLLDIFLNLLLGLTPFTDNFMHLGGFVIGLICASTMLDLVDLFGREGNKMNQSVTMTFLSRFFGVIVSCILMIVALVILFQGDGMTTPCDSCSVLSCVAFPPWASYDKKWYYCDTCDRITANAKIDVQTGQYVELELDCPFSKSVAVNLTDIGIDINQAWIEDNIVPLCRKEC